MKRNKINDQILIINVFKYNFIESLMKISIKGS